MALLRRSGCKWLSLKNSQNKSVEALLQVQCLHGAEEGVCPTAACTNPLLLIPFGKGLTCGSMSGSGGVPMVGWVSHDTAMAIPTQPHVEGTCLPHSAMGQGGPTSSLH